MINNLSVPQFLYHYTKWDTFKAIVENHTWRFSSINHSKDISEILNMYVKDILKDKHLINNLNREVKDNIIHCIDTDNYYGIKIFFIACFSEIEDDPYMWDNEYGYGDKGQGVCIGINSRFFTEHIFRNDDETDHNASDKLGWTKIAYDIQTQKQHLLQITKEYEKYDDAFMDDNAPDLAYKIRNIAMTMKDRIFEKENEYRLIAFNIEGEELDDTFKSLCKDFSKPEKKRLYFKKNENKNIQGDFVVKCIDYDLDSDVREGTGDLFHSILIGSNSDKTERDVKELLEQNGFSTSNITISKSEQVISL